MARIKLVPQNTVPIGSIVSDPNFLSGVHYQVVSKEMVQMMCTLGIWRSSSELLGSSDMVSFSLLGDEVYFSRGLELVRIIKLPEGYADEAR